MSVKRTIARHHTLARGLAKDLPLEVAISGTSYTLEQAERLSRDLVFQELIHFYREELMHE